jgi:hypothetical protein
MADLGAKYAVYVAKHNCGGHGASEGWLGFAPLTLTAFLCTKTNCVLQAPCLSLFLLALSHALTLTRARSLFHSL